MAEYIERKKLEEAFDNADPDVCESNLDGHNDWGFGRENVRDVIKGVPAADVAPVVHARWKYYHKQNKAVCTRCSFERDLDENFGAAISCPNCAAMMDGGED